MTDLWLTKVGDCDILMVGDKDKTDPKGGEKMKKILALMMILMMLSALTLTSGAANTKQEEPPVNFDAVVKEFYKEGEEVTVPGKAPVGESIVYVEPSAVEDMMK